MLEISRCDKKINGVLLFAKPVGISSNRALQKVRKLFKNTKAGHTGTLDPFASGLLPICLGEATKFASFLLDSNKTYQVVGRMGWKSSTGDSEGNLTRDSLAKLPTKQVLKKNILAFKGDLSQKPPMHSALKKNGKRLYQLVRQGKVVTRESRNIKIFDILILDVDSEFFSLKVVCSKGTYIRSLIADIGDRIGCGCYVSKLERTGVSNLTLGNSVSLSKVQSLNMNERLKLVKPVDFLLSQYPKIDFDVEYTEKVRQGKDFLIKACARPEPIIRAYGPGGLFLGIGQISNDCHFRPKRLMATN